MQPYWFHAGSESGFQRRLRKVWLPGSAVRYPKQRCSRPALLMSFSRQCLTLLVLVPAISWGVAPRYLARSESLCDVDKQMCIRGSLVYRSNSRVLSLSGRVSKAPGPGWVRILFRGTNRLDQPSTTIMEFPIRGAHSEIIDKSFIPDNPQIDNWRIFYVVFEPDKEAGRAARGLD
jgi:hypothetical protein